MIFGFLQQKSKIFIMQVHWLKNSHIPKKPKKLFKDVQDSIITAIQKVCTYYIQQDSTLMFVNVVKWDDNIYQSSLFQCLWDTDAVLYLYYLCQ